MMLVKHRCGYANIKEHILPLEMENKRGGKGGGPKRNEIIKKKKKKEKKKVIMRLASRTPLSK